MIASLDHLVLTVADIPATLAFYERALGMVPQSYVVADGSTRHALAFGSQKLNLHQRGQEFDPKAATPLPGSADLCFLTERPVNEVAAHLAALNIPVIEGPVRRTGALGPILSIYLRDPDGNLLEIANRL